MARNLIKRTIDFVNYGMWQIPKESKSKGIYILLREVQIFYVTFKNYSRHNVNVRSAALTFYTLMALVPIVAMIFGVAKGFGVEEMILSMLNKYLADYQIVIEKISEFANAYLANTNVGIFAGVSVFVIIWSVIMVFGSVESAFNFIWDIKKTRNYSRKVSDYLSILFVAPILVVSFNSISSYLEQQLLDIASNAEFLKNLMNIAVHITKLIGVWLVLSVIYFVLPNTKVKYGAALHAAIITGTIYIITSNIYLFFQRSVSSYDIVYGGFAALPLLLMWMNISWQIILFGAELSFAYQNIARYKYERDVSHISNNYHRRLVVIVSYYIIRNFIDKEPPLTFEDMARKANIPMGAVRDVIYDMERAGLILSVEQKGKSRVYIPAYDIGDITVYELLDSVDSAGKDSFEKEYDKIYRSVEKILEGISESAKKSPENILVKDLKIK